MTKKVWSGASWICLFPSLVACSGAEPGPEPRAEVATSAAPLTQAGLRRCGTREPSTADLAAAEAESAADQAEGDAALRSGTTTANKAAPAAGSRQISVYFHVMVNSAGEGDVTPAISAQLAVLNRAYAFAGFKFKLASTEVVQNDDWYYGSPVSAPEAEVAMKAALRQGGPGALNIYTGFNADGLLGWATMPRWYKDDPGYDGVVVLNLTLPGGGLVFETSAEEPEPDGALNYSGGDTLTHEVGHWLGLFHTFDNGGCTLSNDRVLDTPAEAEPQFYCSARDSCTGRRFPGSDPIHNFMDYVDDDCMDRFTPGQIGRMRRQHRFFRAK